MDGCIHRAAGPLLTDECRTLQSCETGQAKITGGYRLPAKCESQGPAARVQGPGRKARWALPHSRALVGLRWLGLNPFGNPGRAGAPEELRACARVVQAPGTPRARKGGPFSLQSPPAQAHARAGTERRRFDPAAPADVIHTVGPIAHGEPSASQAAELRSCYLSSLNLLLEHRLRSAVRAVRAGGPRRGRGGASGGRRVTASRPSPRPGFPLYLHRRLR